MQIRLNKYQSDIFDDSNRIVEVAAGRRSGKTTLSRIMAMQRAKRGNQLIYYYAYTHSLVETLFFEPLIELLPKHWIKHVNKHGKFTIDLVNGSRIVATGIQQYDNRLRGSGINYAICDEAADFPKEFFTRVLYGSLSDKKGDLLVIGKPKGRGNYFYDLSRDPKTSYHHFTTIDAGFVDNEEIDRARYLLDEKSFRQEYEASFEVLSNTVYYNYDSKCISEQGFMRNANTYLCFDFNVNPMSCIINQEITPDVWHVTKEFVIANSNTIETCEIVDNFLQANEFSGTLKATGDYTGSSRKTVSSNTSFSDYTYIDKIFMKYKGYSRRTMKVMSVKDRVLALNARFKNSLGECHQYVNREYAPKLHTALIKLETDTNKLGYMIDGRSEYSHPTDALSYHAYNLYPIFYKQATIGI